MGLKKHYIGLSDDQVFESRNNYGENVLTPPEREPLWKLFLEKFNEPIIRILLIAAFLSLCISFVHMEFAETIGIFSAIILATGISFWFETDANRKFNLLNQVGDDTLYKVIRNGNIHEIPKREIVVGDIIDLGTGEEIPADGVLLEAVSLQIDESCLTGEPITDKTINPDNFNPDATYPSNWAMRGTKIMDGHGIMEVKLVGDATEFGKVAEKSTEISGEETPLNKQLKKLAKVIGVVGFSLAVLTFLVLFIKDIMVGSAIYSTTQIISISILIFSFSITFTKIWLPIIFDAFEIVGIERKLPDSVANGSWLVWIIYGGVTFIILASICFLSGLNLFDSKSWISLDHAGTILNYFMVAVTLIVVSVPEGLPMSVTLSLALSMRRMLQSNNLVRKMHACETMGATTVICTDKTGTLTRNQMQVSSADFFCLKGNELKNDECGNLIKESISVNSTAHLDFSDQNNIKSLGNPTEAALLLWLHEHGINYLPIRENTQIISQLTFSTERKFMASLILSQTSSKKLLLVKGAPEIVLSKCSKVLTSYGVKPLNELSDRIDNLLFQYQDQAMRTLGFAYEYVNDNNFRIENGSLVNSNLIFLGITAISDPVRDDVPDAVAKCLKAGIDIKIVTGDTPGTAREIARQIGIWEEEDNHENIITGTKFEELPDELALERVKKLKVMCRARPTDKQRLVQLLQRNGEIVAVTGDGTNDAPALNYAHIGLSMGSGTSVAKEASDITLLDDSFSSITSAVMWGRSLYQNIQRFIIFQLTINVTALIVVFLGSIIGHEMPLTVTQMLWVNLIIDTFAAGALASLPPNLRVLEDKPRRNDDFIITPQMRFNILFVSISFVLILLGLLFYFNEDGQISRYNLSQFFTIFVMLQFWNLFNAKAFASGNSAFDELNKSTGFVIVLLIILTGQLLIVEFGGDVFRTIPIKLIDWVIIIFSTSTVVWIGEIVRIVNRKMKV